MKKLLLAVIVVGLAIPVHGYITTRRLVGDVIVQNKWASSNITWQLNPGQGSKVTGSRTLSQVAQTSFDAWEAVSIAAVNFTRGADTAATAGHTFDDGINMVKTNLTAGEYAAAGGTGALAITVLSSALYTGQILDADIIFDPGRDFSTDSTTPADKYDLEAVLTHEVGHLLGLDHSAILSSTMFPRISVGSSLARALSADDLAGVASIYPSSTYLARGSISGTVRLTSNATVYGAVVVAVNSSGQPIAHTVTDTRGNYVINGLAAGSYQVYAEPMDTVGGMRFIFQDQDTLNMLFPGNAISTGFTTRFR
jgi:predicted Zn-dependent protease